VSLEGLFSSASFFSTFLLPALRRSAPGPGSDRTDPHRDLTLGGSWPSFVREVIKNLARTTSPGYREPSQLEILILVGQGPASRGAACFVASRPCPTGRTSGFG